MKEFLWIFLLTFYLAHETQAYFGLTGKTQLSDLWSINFDAASLATAESLDTWNKVSDDLKPSREYEAVDMNPDPPNPFPVFRGRVKPYVQKHRPTSSFVELDRVKRPRGFSYTANTPTLTPNLHQDGFFHRQQVDANNFDQHIENERSSSDIEGLKLNEPIETETTMPYGRPRPSNHYRYTTRQPPRTLPRASKRRDRNILHRRKGERASHLENHRSYTTRDTEAATRLSSKKNLNSRNVQTSSDKNFQKRKEAKLSRDIAMIVNHTFSMPRIRSERKSGKRRDLYGVRHNPKQYLVSSSDRHSVSPAQVGRDGRQGNAKKLSIQINKSLQQKMQNQSNPIIRAPSESSEKGVLEFDEEEFNAYSAFIENKMRNFTDMVAPLKIDRKAARKLCKTFRLNSSQRKKCKRDPGLPQVLAKATQMAAAECLYQFRYERWNCSLGTSRIHLLNKGNKETAFLYSISSAGLTHSVARACTEGHLEKCSCEESFEDHLNQESWLWGGCGDNVRFAAKFVRRFLQSQSPGSDVRAKIDQHNSDLGIRFVRSNVRQSCKCHGVSGSCTTKTCWRKMVPFYEIGRKIKRAYDKAVKVENMSNSSGKTTLIRKKQTSRNRDVKIRSPLAAHSESHYHEREKNKRRRLSLDNNRAPHLTRNKHTTRATTNTSAEILRLSEDNTPKKKELIYIDNSPAYCKKSKFSLGTKGRICGKEANCEQMCCGRGFTTHVIIVRRSCECQVKWCCYVQCKTCNERKQIHTCK